MASLDNPHDLSVKFVSLPGGNQVVGIWVANLKSSSDTFTTPALSLDSGGGDSVSILLRSGTDHPGDSGTDQTGITVAGSNAADGTCTVTVSSGSDGQQVVITTLHAKGLSNHTSLDRSP